MARLRIDVDVDGAGQAASELGRVSGGVDRVDSSARRSTGGVGALGGALKAGLVGAAVAAGAALVKLGADSLKMGSDSQQSIGAVQSVFGAYATTVETNAARAADAMGLSATEYRTMATQTGAQLQGLGFKVGETATLTDTLAGRAADMAATFGGTTKEAIDAVGAALRGETDPIEKYGVSLKQSDINARLAATGQNKLTGEALKNAQAQAALDIIMSKTSKTQGQFARESNTAAGAGARLKANTDNLKASLGTALLPALTAVTGGALKLVQGFQSGSGAGGKMRAAMTSMGAAVKSAATPAINALKGAVDQVRGALARNPQVAQALAAALTRLGSIAKVVGNIVGGSAAGQFRIIGAAISAVIGIAGSLISAFQSVSAWAGRVMGAISRVKSALSSGLGKAGAILGLGRTATPTLTAGLARGQASTVTGTSIGRTTALTGPGGGPFHVVNLTVNGALDPDAVARQIEKLLDGANRRRGGLTVAQRAAGTHA